MTTEVSLSSSPPAAALRQAAAPALFFLLGTMFATWAARIPAIRDGLHLSAAQLGLVLLCGGIGSVASYPLSSGLIGHYGPRRAAWYAGLGLVFILPCLALAPRLAWLMAAMACYGAACGCFDVAVNALGAATEKNAGRSLMSLLHAWFCVGTLCGALLGSLLAGAGVSPQTHFSLTSALLILPLWLAYRALPNDRPSHAPPRSRFALPHGALVALGIIGFCGAIAEGSIGDWSAVFMKDHLGAGDGIAPLAYAAFSALMLAARLVGDRLKDRLGARRVVTCGALLAAAGIFSAVAASQVAPAIAGFALAGAGLAAVFPFVFSAAGRHGPTALAGVATMAYSGGLIGPPAIGFIAHNMGLPMALAFIGVLSVAVALVAARASWLA